MEDMSGYYHQTASLHNPPHPYYPQPYPPPPSAAPAPPPPHPSYQHHQQQQPYALPHHPHPLPHPSIDEVRTLFIAGLPGDAKHREIYNLFREFPGYESCQLRSSGQSSQAFAFAVFSDQQSAVAAIHALNGLMFDLEKESTLHIDLAKSNSRSKRSRPDDGRPYYSEKKVKGSAAFSRNHPDAVGSATMQSSDGLKHIQVQPTRTCVQTKPSLRARALGLGWARPARKILCEPMLS